MSLVRIAAALAGSVLLASCGTLLPTRDGALAASVAEIESGYTYIPVDPFPVESKFPANCQADDYVGNSALFGALPDNAVRMLVERIDRSGAITYGISKAGAKDESYRVTIDYINADTINVPISIIKIMKKKVGNEISQVSIFATDLSEFIPGYERYEVTRLTTLRGVSGFVFNIPVYVGVGLRISSNVFVTGTSANISGIGVIGAEAEANRLTGSLVVQTLGVNGQSIAAALPIQSELNRTTAQNAIVAVGSIKALLYDDKTIASPRVVGLYLPFPGGKALVNALISELSKEKVSWDRPCWKPRSPPKSGANG